jgi:2-methylcitrate dehydratase PrpD
VTVAVNSPGRLHSWIVEQLDDVPTATIAEKAAVTRSFRDTMGVALAGARQESTQWAKSYAQGIACDGPASVWGTHLHLDRASAALVNGTSVQALEFDDVTPAQAAHLSSVVVPTLAAFADQIEPSRAVDGLVHGWRVAAAVGDLVGFDAHSRGVQPTHTLGPLVAAVAAAHGLSLTEGQARTALALAVIGAIGLRANTGTHTKALQSGLAASATVRAIEMARLGSGSPHDAGGSAIDSLFIVLGADESAVERVVSTPLPDPTFLAVKPYPTCGAAHSSIEAVLAVRARVPDGTTPDRLEVRVPPRVPRAMAFARPSIGDEARWSLHYALATAWETGRVDVAEFDDAAVARAAERRAHAWLEIIGDPSFEPRGERAVVTMTSGRTVETTETVHRPGYPQRPLSNDAVRSKFERCMSAAGVQELGRDLWEGLGSEPFEWFGRTAPPGMRDPA